MHGNARDSAKIAFWKAVYRSLDVEAVISQRILRPMPVSPDRAWQLPWLRLPLFMRDVLAVPWGKDWPIVKRELARCAELRRAMIQGGVVQVSDDGG